ncbi:MAG: spermidine/putrescine transporter ATPase, partial [Devosia sp.]|nr:spermidine/putrescine transporter ATPase [Devosia sp.]
FVGFENLIPMTVAARDGAGVTAEAAGGVRLTLSQDQFGAIPDNFTLACRADGLAVTAGADGIPATLGLRTYLGRAYQYQCDTPAGHLTANGPLTRPLDIGATAKLVPVPEQCTILAPE